MVKLLWWFTSIFVCRDCGAAHEYDVLPEDDTCPICGKPALLRQVMEWGHLVDYDPKRHIK